jgi:type IV pilus assembly protein PilX
MNKQRGISLIVVLIGLVIIGFAAVALLRSTDTATLIAGNLGFKKAALATAGTGDTAAVTWLNGNAGVALHDDISASGYFATSADACDLTGSITPDDPADDVQWDPTDADPGNACQMVGRSAAAGDYDVHYIINRMCNVEGDPANPVAADGVTPRICSRSVGESTESSTAVGAIYGDSAWGGSSRLYYRITTRVNGPRDTVRYTQTFVVL